MLRTTWIACLFSLLLVACGKDEPANDAPAQSNPPVANETECAGSTNDREPEESVEPEEPGQQTPEDQRSANYVAFEGGLRAYPEDHKVELEAWLLGGQTRPLEYLLVLPGGNTHESLFATGARGLHLKRALEIIGLNEGTIKRNGRGYLDPPVGDRVRLSVRFTHAETKEEVTVPVEKWLWDHDAGTHPADAGFIFAGGFEKFRPELNRSIFDADRKGNLIALWRDASCVLDNDREKAYVPDIYSPYPDADGMPKVRQGMTPIVTLIFEPWKD